MVKREEYEIKTTRMLEPIIEENNFELVDVEYVKEGGNYILRAYIDKEGGITIDDCELVSRRLSDLLDEDDFIEGEYLLEVSSPGLGRQLKKENDFRRSVGKEVEVKLFAAINKKKEFCGILTGYDEQKVVLEDEKGDVLELERKNIAIIKLAVHF